MGIALGMVWGLGRGDANDGAWSIWCYQGSRGRCSCIECSCLRVMRVICLLAILLLGSSAACFEMEMSPEMIQQM